MDGRLLIVLAYVIESSCVLVLIGFTWSGSREILWVVFAMGLFGAGRALWMPTSQAMTVNLVPQSAFPAAVAFNSTLFESAVIVGPALGGLLYAFGESVTTDQGAMWVYVSALAILVVVLWLMFGIRPVRAPPTEAKFAWHELAEGFRFVLRRRSVLGAISLDLFAVLFGGATALLPMFAADILHVGPEGLGLLRTAPGVGAALTAIWLARRPISRHAGRWMFGGVAVFGVSTVVFGLSPHRNSPTDCELDMHWGHRARTIIKI